MQTNRLNNTVTFSRMTVFEYHGRNAALPIFSAFDRPATITQKPVTDFISGNPADRKRQMTIDDR
jgi:hypothetical protein